MKTLETRRLTGGVKTMLVLACAFMTGFMWRVRGDRGYGSMWGMFAVGVMLTLFIFAFFGNRKKMTYEAIPAAVILLGITNGSWGTLNSQMGGYLYSGTPFTGAESAEVISISPFSGLWIMLLLGFGWMPLFALFIGSLFSKREYKIRHYVLLVAVFYIVSLAFQASAAHYIMPFINGEATDMFAKGLADKGVEFSPMMAYIRNYGSEAWAKTIPFGRNYFAEIKAISHAAAALITSLFALIALRDKRTALISTGINAICALSITLADSVMILGSDSGFLAGVNAPAVLTNNAWPLWEFFTGFLLGLGIMLLLVCLPKKITAGEGRFEYDEPFKSKNIHAIYSALFTFFFTFGVTVARPAGIRIADQLSEAGIISNLDAASWIIMASICVPALVISCVIVRRNVISRGLPVPAAMRVEDFCMKAAPIYFLVTTILYFFTGNAYALKLPIEQMKSLSSFVEMIRDSWLAVAILMVVGFIVFNIFFSAARKRAVMKK